MLQRLYHKIHGFFFLSSLEISHEHAKLKFFLCVECTTSLSDAVGKILKLRELCFEAVGVFVFGVFTRFSETLVNFFFFFHTLLGEVNMNTKQGKMTTATNKKKTKTVGFLLYLDHF